MALLIVGGVLVLVGVLVGAGIVQTNYNRILRIEEEYE